MTLQNYLKTWDNMMEKGWQGPSCCILCKKDSKSMDHLFINCEFTPFIWKNICLSLNIPQLWKRNFITVFIIG